MRSRCREARSALAAALEHGDVAAAGACYSADAQLLTPAAGLIQGRKAIEEYWRTGIALGLSSVSFEARRVERLGARQVEIGRYRVAAETETTDARCERGTYLVLHRQAIDGTWQRAVDVLDPDEPQGSHPIRQGGKND
jgi:ketosteroid isomerase-like protein